MRALIYAQMGELTLADESYQRALQPVAQQSGLSNNYGGFLCQNGRGAEAHRAISRRR